jgi:hypothetical protein
LATDKEFPCSFETIVRKILRLLFHVLAHIYHVHFKEIVLLGLHSHLNCIFAHLVLFNKQFALLDPKELDVLHDLAIALKLLSEPSEPMQCVTPSPTPEPQLSSGAPLPGSTVSAALISPTQADSSDSAKRTAIDVDPDMNVIRSGRGTPMESESLPGDAASVSQSQRDTSCSTDPNDSGVITTQCRSISPFANAGSLLTLANVASEMSSNLEGDSGKCESNDSSDDCPMHEATESPSICDSQPTPATNLLQQFSVQSSNSACVPGAVQSITSGYWSIDEPPTDGAEKRQLEPASAERRVHKRKSFGELATRGWTRESADLTLVTRGSHSFDRQSCCTRSISQATEDWPKPIVPIESMSTDRTVDESDGPTDTIQADHGETMSMDEASSSSDTRPRLPSHFSSVFSSSTSAAHSSSHPPSIVGADSQSMLSTQFDSDSTHAKSRHRVTQSFGCLQLQPESGAL